MVGHVFWDQALAAIDPAALDCLALLLHKELVVKRDEAAFDDTREYAFKHHLLHQVTYDSVLKAPKRSGHARVGAFWSARAEVTGPLEVDAAKCRALAEAQYHRCQSDPQDYVGWFEKQFPNYMNAYAARTLWPLAEQLVEICERHFGRDHPMTAVALTNLARVAVIQRSVENVESNLRRAIDIQERSLNPDDPAAALTVAVLAGFHEGRGDFRAAELEYRRALDTRERVLGPDHELTLGTLDNLAKIYVELGRLDEAELLFRRVLTARERGLGHEHSETAFALTALGEVLAKKGNHAAAEPLIRRALAVQQNSLPPDHPDTGLSMWHLAETLRGLRRSDEAEPLARHTLAIWQASFGPDHEWTAWALISLAETRLAQGDASEAAGLAERAARVLQRVFGAEHPVLASTLTLQARATGIGRAGHGRAADSEPRLTGTTIPSSRKVAPGTNYPHNLSTESIMKANRLQPRAAFSVASLLAIVTTVHMGVAVAQTPTKVPSGDPCTVVPLSEVQKAFPGAKPGERSTRIEKYGLTECSWKDGSGVLVFGVQEFYGSDSAMEEIKSFGQATVDGNTANFRNVRFEILTSVGLGNDAVAFVEARDDKRGIVHGGAMLVLHRGQRTLFLTSLALTQRDRAAALKTFEALGRIAAKRLD